MLLAPPTIEELLASPLSKFITIVANNCIYSGSFTEIFVTAVHPFFLKINQKQAKRIIPIGINPWINHLHMNTGKQLRKKLILWKEWVLGMLLIAKMTWTSLMVPGPSIAHDSHGIMKKFKAHFFACGEQQLEGNDFFGPCCPMGLCLPDAHPWEPPWSEIQASWCHWCLSLFYSWWS